jgi:methyl-accepting chemotaxis protein
MTTPTVSRGAGGFEQSFMFHMIRDFFLLLLLVAAVELGIRYVSLRLDFMRQEPARVTAAATQLANDVRSIMLNSGGPLAAQTVYPILNRNYDDLGLAISVLPSAVTVASMLETFKTEVRGLQPSWPEGPHEEASVTLAAEQFCLSCHVKAKLGDVLGTVSVRSYLARKEAVWWQEVRLTAGALSLKIVVHTIVLFLLLKVRMEPLLVLRSTVSGLAKGVMDLRPRAAVRTADEFGELAQDLNHFLDRIGLVVTDLDRILGEVVAVGARLGALNRSLEQQVDGMREASVRQIGTEARRGLDTRLLAAREQGAFDVLDRTMAQTLAALQAEGASAEPVRELLRDQLESLRTRFATVTEALNEVGPPAVVTESQSIEWHAFAQSLRQMAMLEATMQKVAESGQQVLHRLTTVQRER